MKNQSNLSNLKPGNLKPVYSTNRNICRIIKTKSWDLVNNHNNNHKNKNNGNNNLSGNKIPGRNYYSYFK